MDITILSGCSTERTFRYEGAIYLIEEDPFEGEEDREREEDELDEEFEDEIFDEEF